MTKKKFILTLTLVLFTGIVAVAAVIYARQSLRGQQSAQTKPAASAAAEKETAGVEAARSKAIELAQSYARQYDYERALYTISDPAVQNDLTAKVAADIKAQKDSLVLYKGDIRHIFFHSLIVYPEMIFKDKTTPMGGYNAGFAEKAELEKILPQLYERNYVLYDLAECFEMRDGKMARKDIWLPPGKQPLILSVDDVAYAYGNGYAQKLAVRDDGALVNLVRNPEGVTEEMPDGDVFGVVDAFVKEHPDFSYRGHKGTLAMTGFQGAFGYSFEKAEDQAEIRKVVSALRADGWNFASHSYTHNSKNFFGPNSKPENIKYDTDKWMRIAAPFFGPTNLYIAPFGYRAKGEGLQHILDAGFQIYCVVGRDTVNEVHDAYGLMSRIEIGGYAMTHFKDVLNKYYFNVDEVYDAAGRPPVIG